jgi:heptosyltransferase-3
MWTVRDGRPARASINLPSRRLIVRPGGIGDCILSLPAIEHLRTDYTEVWAPTSMGPLIRSTQAQSISSSGIDLLGLPGVAPPGGLIDKLRSFDSIVSWYGSNRAEFREHVRGLGLPFQFLDALPDPRARLHAADFFLRQVGGEERAVPRIETEHKTPGDFAVIHPFSGSAKKNWPLDRFREVAARLPIPVRWCAGPEEKLPDAARFENLHQLACWLASARLYIGNDSGITHLAAAVGVPVVAIFGPTDPAVWAPRGERVAVVSAGSLDEIGVDNVVEAAQDVSD